MRREALVFTCAILLSLPLLAYQDTDMDGVEDTLDKCPNTPFTALADQDGCTTQSLVSPNHFDIIVGQSYSRMNDVGDTKSVAHATSLQVDYYRNNFAASISTSHYAFDTNGTRQSSGMNNTIASMSLNNRMGDTTLSTTLGAIFPTYKTGYNNETIDPFIAVGLNHSLSQNFDLFGGYTYTLIREKDIPSTVYYNNTGAFYAGLRGTFGDSFSLSASYNQSDSMFVGAEKIQSASLFAYAQLTSHWFTTLSTSYGLSDAASKYDGTLRLGYYF